MKTLKNLTFDVYLTKKLLSTFFKRNEKKESHSA